MGLIGLLSHYGIALANLGLVKKEKTIFIVSHKNILGNVSWIIDSKLHFFTSISSFSPEERTALVLKQWVICNQFNKKSWISDWPLKNHRSSGCFILYEVFLEDPFNVYYFNFSVTYNNFSLVSTCFSITKYPSYHFEHFI